MTIGKGGIDPTITMTTDDKPYTGTTNSLCILVLLGSKGCNSTLLIRGRISGQIVSTNHGQACIVMTALID